MKLLVLSLWMLRFDLALLSFLSHEMLIFFPKQFVATVNTFHNCAHHDCAIEQTRVVWQERLENSALKGFTVHHSNNQDRIINLAQMRSAALLCHFNGSYVFSEIGFRQSALVGVNSFRAGTNVVSGSPK